MNYPLWMIAGANLPDGWWQQRFERDNRDMLTSLASAERGLPPYTPTDPSPARVGRPED